MITVPEILKLPDIVMPIISGFNDHRFFLLEGGRGSGKTQSIARWILYIGEKRPVRIFCARETQSSVEDSVYTVFRDLIKRYKLNYTVFKESIIHNTTGSKIRFKGFREQGAENIKGIEGCDILWIDEAQAITKNTLDTIIPTIRKAKSKVFFSMNRHTKADPVYTRFNTHPKCLSIRVNYVDNPYCSQELIDEAELCKIEAPEDYQHIWMGEPMAASDNYLFREDMLNACIDRSFPYDPNKYDSKIMGCDVARFGDNYSAGVVIKQVGPNQWSEIALERWKNFDAVYTTGKFNEMMSVHRPDITIVDADGLGGSVYDVMSNNRRDTRAFYGGKTDGIDKSVHKNWRSYGYMTLANMVNKGWLRINSKFILDQLRGIQYRFDLTGRKYVIPKEQLIEKARARGIRYNSPDEADALMMASTMIAAVEHEKRMEYSNSHGRIRGNTQVYAREDDLI